MKYFARVKITRHKVTMLYARVRLTVAFCFTKSRSRAEIKGKKREGGGEGKEVPPLPLRAALRKKGGCNSTARRCDVFLWARGVGVFTTLYDLQFSSDTQMWREEIAGLGAPLLSRFFNESLPPRRLWGGGVLSVLRSHDN